jgi:hypothetical protein
MKKHTKRSSFDEDTRHATPNKTIANNPVVLYNNDGMDAGYKKQWPAAIPHDRAHQPMNAGKFIQRAMSGNIFFIKEPVFINSEFMFISL